MSSSSRGGGRLNRRGGAGELRRAGGGSPTARAGPRRRATTRIAATSSAGDVLEQEAAGPGAQRRVDVLVEVEGGQDEHPGAQSGAPRIRRVASMPSMPGIRTSMSTTSGRDAASAATASTRWRPRRRRRCRARSRIMRKPARTSAWSSTTRTADQLPLTGGRQRQRPSDRDSRHRAACRSSADRRRSVDPFTHADEPVAAIVAYTHAAPRAVVADPRGRPRVGQRRGRRPTAAPVPRMLEHVGERLLDDAVRRQVDARRAAAVVRALDGEVDGDAGVAGRAPRDRRGRSRPGWGSAQPRIHGRRCCRSACRGRRRAGRRAVAESSVQHVARRVVTIGGEHGCQQAQGWVGEQRLGPRSGLDRR